MGLNFSVFFRLHNGSQPPSSSPFPGLGDLPESCAADVLKYLTPVEICILGKMNRAFRGASWADFVWDSKLPSNYRVLVQRLIGDVGLVMCKREIYTRLCQLNQLDGGNKVISFMFWWVFFGFVKLGQIVRLFVIFVFVSECLAG